MYNVKLNNRYSFKVDNTVIEGKAGYQFILPNELAEQLPQTDAFTVVPFLNDKEYKEPIDLSGKKLLISRTGGIGDMFFILCSVDRLKKQYPDLYVEFACAPRYMGILENLFKPHLINKVIPVVIPQHSYVYSDYFFTFENYIENNPEARSINAFELISRKFFVDLKGNHHLDIKIPLKYTTQALELSSKWETKIIGMQVNATATIRTYPYYEQQRLIQMLGNDGYKVLLLDKQDVLERVTKNWDAETLKYIELPYSDKIPQSFELACALVAKCECLVAPDSIFVYIGDSLNIPTIGIYSPFSSQLRATGLDVYAFDVIESCYNCNSHVTIPCKWSIDGWSPCLKAIKSGYIFALIKNILNNSALETKLV